MVDRTDTPDADDATGDDALGRGTRNEPKSPWASLSAQFADIFPKATVKMPDALVKEPEPLGADIFAAFDPALIPKNPVLNTNELLEQMIAAQVAAEEKADRERTRDHRWRVAGFIVGGIGAIAALVAAAVGIFG